MKNTRNNGRKKSKAQKEAPLSAPPARRDPCLEFFGMWRKRSDMKNPQAWVRALREEAR